MTSSTFLALMALLLLGIFSSSLAIGLDKSEPNDPGYWNLQRPLDFDQRALEGYADSDLLGKLLSPPAKRYWCRRGMTYNPLLGGCKLSFSAMRSGRGRRH